MFDNSVNDKEKNENIMIFKLFALKNINQHIWNMIHSNKKKVFADFLYTRNCLLIKLEKYCIAC